MHRQCAGFHKSGLYDQGAAAVTGISHHGKVVAQQSLWVFLIHEPRRIQALLAADLRKGSVLNKDQFHGAAVLPLLSVIFL